MHCLFGSVSHWLMCVNQYNSDRHDAQSVGRLTVKAKAQTIKQTFAHQALQMCHTYASCCTKLYYRYKLLNLSDWLQMSMRCKNHDMKAVPLQTAAVFCCKNCNVFVRRLQCHSDMPATSHYQRSSPVEGPGKPHWQSRGVKHMKGMLSRAVCQKLPKV